jgi:hypothetical protein
MSRRDGLLLELTALASTLDVITDATERGATTWSRGGIDFAVLSDAGAELRLDPAIAAAALRTPDTGPSARGAEWVRFNPRVLDGPAVDRLRAWFELAHRRTGA